MVNLHSDTSFTNRLSGYLLAFDGKGEPRAHLQLCCFLFTFVCPIAFHLLYYEAFLLLFTPLCTSCFCSTLCDTPRYPSGSPYHTFGLTDGTKRKTLASLNYFVWITLANLQKPLHAKIQIDLPVPTTMESPIKAWFLQCHTTLMDCEGVTNEVPQIIRYPSNLWNLRWYLNLYSKIVATFRFSQPTFVTSKSCRKGNFLQNHGR